MNQKSFPKTNRLLTSKDFASLRTKGTEKLHLKTLKLIFRSNDSECSRLGFAVSKKVGKAVVRNLIKRHLREWFRQSGLSSSGHDLFIIIHPKFKTFGEDAFLENLKADLDKIHLRIST